MKVLVAVDDSPFAHHILESISVRRWPEDCIFRIVTVNESTTGWFSGAEEPPYAEDVERRSHLQVHLADLAAYVRKHLPRTTVETQLLQGAPSDQILRAAREWSADLIIIGQQGRSNVGGASLGAIAESVVHKAPCSVEIVKPKILVQPRAG